MKYVFLSFLERVPGGIYNVTVYLKGVGLSANLRLVRAVS